MSRFPRTSSTGYLDPYLACLVFRTGMVGQCGSRRGGGRCTHDV